MGCVLGPTYANFYMGYLENKIFSQYGKPKMYCRYVDDIFIAIDNEKEMINLINSFEDNSVLKFTHEIQRNNNL